MTRSRFLAGKDSIEEMEGPRLGIRAGNHGGGPGAHSRTRTAATRRERNDVVEPTPTTVAPDPETMSDLEVIEAGVAALYSGDAERAVELFGIEDSPVWRNQAGGDDEAQIRDDDLIRQEAAYQAAIGGRLSLNCTEEVNTPGMFTCFVPYHNALTDAVGYVDSPGDRIQVVVQDGVITQFGLVEETSSKGSPTSFLSTMSSCGRWCPSSERKSKALKAAGTIHELLGRYTDSRLRPPDHRQFRRLGRLVRGG